MTHKRITYESYESAYVQNDEQLAKKTICRHEQLIHISEQKSMQEILSQHVIVY